MISHATAACIKPHRPATASAIACAFMLIPTSSVPHCLGHGARYRCNRTAASPRDAPAAALVARRRGVVGDHGRVGHRPRGRARAGTGQ